jgi:glycosyltransferase involved in cell wall biosynthesis
MHAVIIGTDARTLINFRGEFLKLLLEKNIVITCVSTNSDLNSINQLINLGVEYRTISLARNGLNITKDIKTIFDIFMVFRKNRPDFVLAYGIKPVIWSGIVARFSKIPFSALITGLGFAFYGSSYKRILLTKMVVFLYKLSLKRSKAVIFQNLDNRDAFLGKGIIGTNKAHVVNGSGVDLLKFSVVPLPQGSINFLCIARLLGEKGLREFAKASKKVKKIFPLVEFTLVGEIEISPDAISVNEVCSWEWINYKGFSNDVRGDIGDCHVFVLPSYHEGTPRSALEAMSMARPVITTNAVGCKDVVENNFNGFQVPVGSVDLLVEKIIWFIENPQDIQTMGLNSRLVAEQKYDVHKVNNKMLKIIGIQ